MADNIIRTKGRGASYKFDKGGVPAEFGPYIGVIKNNIDPTRSGRLQVYIEQLGGNNPDDPSLWRTVSYCPPFYGVTPRNNATGSAGTGTYKGNQQSYGMWFTPPDLGVQVICFFVAGDPNQGYWLACVPDPGVTHMIPAIGASRNYITKNSQQETEISAADAKQMPVVEINQDNPGLEESPRFFDQEKPIHDYVYTVLLNQGLLGDYIRGPISSSAQRESPSSVFGMSSPGRPIYQGVSGIQSEEEVLAKVQSGAIKIEDVKIEGRRGGHSIIMDDGDLRGRDNLIRIRTAKGHQITMSDEADCLYIIAANGQTWIELGSEGTVDVYSTNSVNVRSQGEINLHADKNININAGENLNIRAKNMQVETKETLNMSASTDFTLYSKTKLGVKSDGGINLDAKTGGWKASGGLKLRGSRIDLNGGSAPESVTAPKVLVEYKLDDTKFVAGTGWQKQEGTLETIVPRAPTHEPYPYHNRGVPVEVDLSASASSPPSPSVSQALGTASSQVPSTTINAADVLSTPPASVGIGSLDKSQVSGLLAQSKAITNQNSSVFSIDKGIGEYGLQPVQLESAGYLKPGTMQQALAAVPSAPTAADIAEANRLTGLGLNYTPQQVAQQRTVQEILSAPTSWTGKSGVSSFSSLLGDSNLQNQVQQGLLQNSLSGLQTSGLAKGTESASVLAPLLAVASKFGIANTSSFVKGVAAPDINSAMSSLTRNSQFTTSFITDKLGAFTSLSRRAASVTNTVNRAAVDSALTASLGDPKIPAPSYKPQVRKEDQPSQFQDQRDSFQDKVDEASIFFSGVKTQLDALYDSAQALRSSDNISASQVDALESRLTSVRNLYNNNREKYLQPIQDAVNSAPIELRDEFNSQYLGYTRQIRILQGLVASVREIIAELRARQTT
jgi:hypothetical protein